jgi:imidazolonepropionase-like amidohydrolase
VRNVADVARAWPKLLADHPDLVKVFLAYSEEYARRRDDPRFGARRGLDPKLLPSIVRRAHAANLHVAAHVETAADFRAAVNAGVDEIAHIPFYDDSLGRQRYLLTPADARAAAQHGIPVMTTIYWSAQTGPDDTTAARRRARDVVRQNLETLRAAGVQLLVGSDQFRHSSVVEAEALAATHVFTPFELVRLWASATPHAIFPDRRIGRLADGYEASFLVLDGDPSRDFAATQRIALRMKQGTLLHPSETDGQMPPLPTS